MDAVDIWIHDVARGSKTRVTQDLAEDDEPVWSPSGDQIAFTSTRDSSYDIFLVASDGSGVEPLVTGPSHERAPNWSRDGRYLAYHSVDSETGSRDLWYLDLSQEADPVSFLQTGFEECVPQISPDSQFLAYQSNEQGRWDIFVSRFPSGEDKRHVSVNGGMHPRWSLRGDELFYLEGDTLMVVAVETDPSLSLGDPEVLFSARPIGLQLLPAGEPDFPNYNVDNEGQRFVAVQVAPSERGTDSHFVVVQNWSEEFRPEN
ncbi:hypothetical protein MYX84_14795 [Acidobacteria bacterium AH-259-O06]|nr:hypothetical protein [Acidobacteria bacterium AH-259-O06]